MVIYTLKPKIKKQSLVISLVLTLIFAFLITPSLAIPNYGTNYITPKLGASIYGEYWYTSDSIDWYLASPSFESNGGYYDIYDDGKTIDFQITLNTTFSGELYLVLNYINDEGLSDYSYYLVHSGNSGDYSHLRYSKEITLPSNAYANCDFTFVLSDGFWYGNPSDKWSKRYSFFTKRGLNTNWKQKRLITISSDEKMKDGVTELNLNSTTTKDIYLKYTEDDDNTYTGIITDMVFTNDDYTKAYPYFVNKYKGGYYEFNRNTTNITTVDLWVNEDTTSKNLYMFYDYKDSYVEKYPNYLEVYSFGWTLDDRPNNPFTVHQIFSDWRWNSSFTPFDYSGGIYNRGSYLDSGDITNIPYNRIDEFYFRIMIGGGLVIVKTMFADNSSQFIDEEYYAEQITLYNSTGGSQGYNFGTGVHNYNGHYIYNGTHRVLNLSGTVLSIPEANNYLYMNENHLDSDYRDRIYYFYDLPDNTISYSISNASATKYAYINFIDLQEYESFTNDLWIGGYFEVDSPGLFLCQDSDKNILGSVNIEKDATLESFNIIFPYTITNKTKFLNLSEFNYTCSFISSVGGFEVNSENKTINFTSDKIFLDTIKPHNQNNYTSEYIAYNINSELNYTGIQTDFSLTTNKIKCLKFSDDQCIKYDYVNEFNHYNASNISMNYNYNNIYELDTNSWYQQYYQFCRNGICLSTPSRLFYVYKETAIIKPPAEDYIDWNNTELTNNTEFMQNRFWNNPLSYLSSMLYQNFIIPNVTDASAQNIFLWVFTIFWNFYTILIAIAISIYQAVPNIVLSIAGTIPFLLTFSYIGWIGVASTTIYLLIAIIITVKLWKQ